MNRNLTTGSILKIIIMASVFYAMFIIIYTIVGLFLLSTDTFEDDIITTIMYYGLSYGISTIYYLLILIYYLRLNRRFKQLLKTSQILHGNLDDLKYPSFFASFFLGGCRAIVDGRYSYSIYPGKLHGIGKVSLINTEVQYITDGYVIYLI